MAKKINHGQSKESSTPDQEQPPVAEQEPTAPSQLEDFSKLDAEQKAERISQVLNDSAELASAYQDIELEVAGGNKELAKQEKLGWTDRFKVWRAGGQESAPGKKKEREIKKEKFKERSLAEIAEIAHQAVETKLGVIEQTQGQQLLNQRAALAAHEKNAVSDLENLEGLGVHSEDELKDIRTRLGEEKATMEQEVEKKKADLESNLAKFREPATEKKEQLDTCAVEYKGYLDNVTGEIRTVRGNVAKFERGLANLKMTGPTAEKYRGQVSQALEEQRSKLAKLEASEQALKQRLDLVKSNQSQVNDYLEKVNNIGKTLEERRQRKDEARKKNRGKEVHQAEKTGQRKATAAPAGGPAVPGVGAGAGTGQPNAQEATVPLMMTRDMKQQLTDRGVSKRVINNLTPEEAWEIINKGKPKAQAKERLITPPPPSPFINLENKELSEAPAVEVEVEAGQAGGQENKSEAEQVGVVGKNRNKARRRISDEELAGYKALKANQAGSGVNIVDEGSAKPSAEGAAAQTTSETTPSEQQLLRETKDKLVKLGNSLAEKIVSEAELGNVEAVKRQVEELKQIAGQLKDVLQKQAGQGYEKQDKIDAFCKMLDISIIEASEQIKIAREVRAQAGRVSGPEPTKVDAPSDDSDEEYQAKINEERGKDREESWLMSERKKVALDQNPTPTKGFWGRMIKGWFKPEGGLRGPKGRGVEAPVAAESPEPEEPGQGQAGSNEGRKVEEPAEVDFEKMEEPVARIQDWYWALRIEEHSEERRAIWANIFKDPVRGYLPFSELPVKEVYKKLVNYVLDANQIEGREIRLKKAEAEAARNLSVAIERIKKMRKKTGRTGDKSPTAAPTAEGTRRLPGVVSGEGAIGERPPLNDLAKALDNVQPGEKPTKPELTKTPGDTTNLAPEKPPVAGPEAAKTEEGDSGAKPETINPDLNEAQEWAQLILVETETKNGKAHDTIKKDGHHITDSLDKLAASFRKKEGKEKEVANILELSRSIKSLISRIKDKMKKAEKKEIADEFKELARQVADLKI